MRILPRVPAIIGPFDAGARCRGMSSSGQRPTADEGGHGPSNIRIAGDDVHGHERTCARGFELAALGAASVGNAHRSDPDVQGAQRLFSAWLEGQMLDRHLPGIAVGVVADQELMWAAGFGFADTRPRRSR